MAQPWEKSGNFDWSVHHACPQTQVIRVFFVVVVVVIVFFFMVGRNMCITQLGYKNSQNLKIGCQIHIIIIIMEFETLSGKNQGILFS